LLSALAANTATRINISYLDDMVLALTIAPSPAFAVRGLHATERSLL
jgi:hypothetical protein